MCGAFKRLSQGVSSWRERKRAISRLVPPWSSQRRSALWGMGTIQSGAILSRRAESSPGLMTRACSSTCRRKGERREACSPPPIFHVLKTRCARPTAEIAVITGGDSKECAPGVGIARRANGQGDAPISSCGSQQTAQSAGEGSRDSKHSLQREVSPGMPVRQAGHRWLSARRSWRKEPVSWRGRSAMARGSASAVPLERADIIEERPDFGQVIERRTIRRSSTVGTRSVETRRRGIPGSFGRRWHSRG